MAEYVKLVEAFVEGMKPIGNRVVIRVEKISKVTAGGLLLPNSVAEAQRPARGVVVLCGPDCEEIAVGDYAVFMMYAGSVVEHPDEAKRTEDEKNRVVYRVVREKEVFGVWKSNDWKYLAARTPLKGAAPEPEPAV